MNLFLVALLSVGSQIFASPSGPPPGSECTSKIYYGLNATKSVCGADFAMFKLNVMGEVMNNATAYTEYLDKVCSSPCVTAVGQTIEGALASCYELPHGVEAMVGPTATIATEAEVLPLKYKYNFLYACLKEAGEYCLVKQIKAANATGKSYPTELLPADRTDICVPCLVNQTSLMAEYKSLYYALHKASATDAVSTVNALKNNCSNSSLANPGAITNVALYNMTIPPKPTPKPTPTNPPNSSSPLAVSFITLALLLMSIF